MSKFMLKGMYLVCLDQCVLSRFIKKPQNEPWRDLCDLILRGNDKRKILCPTSLEHLVETAALSESDAYFLDELMMKFSFGWSLASEPRLIAHQIMSHLTQQPTKRGDFLEKGIWRSMRHPGTLNELREIRTGMDAYNVQLVRGHNEINKILRNGKNGDAAIRKFLIRRRTGNYLEPLMHEIRNAQKIGRVAIVADEHNPKMANRESLILFTLVKKRRLSPKESVGLLHDLESQQLEFIPTLKIKAEMEAVQFFRREKVEPRDQYDITRAACALPYADLFITDGGKASMIRELGLHSLFSTEVFSLGRSELPQLLARLKQIVDS